jgi:hypothetical protein
VEKKDKVKDGRKKRRTMTDTWRREGVPLVLWIQRT